MHVYAAQQNLRYACPQSLLLLATGKSQAKTTAAEMHPDPNVPFGATSATFFKANHAVSAQWTAGYQSLMLYTHGAERE